jgi:transcriptional regulator with GAF, ATPase, and Fis domain
MNGFMGRAPRIVQLRDQIERLSTRRSPVLIQGESGTGKEVVARSLYDGAPRGQFVPIDCGSLVGTMMESELFGHVRGAFTGAVDTKKGLIETAHGGTAFFDEIGELPLEMQVKLLRVLQEQELRPVGSLQRIRIDVRVVAATNRDLQKEVAAGRFREDLSPAQRGTADAASAGRTQGRHSASDRRLFESGAGPVCDLERCDGSHPGLRLARQCAGAQKLP